MSVNRVTLIGNMGDDVKIKQFDGGNCVGSFSLATNESYVDKATGDKVTQTEWHNIVAKNRTAEILAQYTKKGDQIYLEGKLQTRKWEDNTGNTRYITEVIVLGFNFLNNKQA